MMWASGTDGQSWKVKNGNRTAFFPPRVTTLWQPLGDTGSLSGPLLGLTGRQKTMCSEGCVKTIRAGTQLAGSIHSTRPSPVFKLLSPLFTKILLSSNRNYVISSWPYFVDNEVNYVTWGLLFQWWHLYVLGSAWGSEDGENAGV